MDCLLVSAKFFPVPGERKKCRESEKHTATTPAAAADRIRVHRQKHEIYVETSELENVFFFFG